MIILLSLIGFSLFLLIAIVSFIAGLLLAANNKEIKTKAEYLAGIKKKIQVFQSKELEIDQEKQRAVKENQLNNIL